MAQQYSFDVVSEFDISELDHAIDQARREISNRFDFKGTPASVDFADSDKNGLTIEGESEYQLTAILDLIRTKLAKRSLSQKIIDVSQKPDQAGMILRQKVPFQQGLDQEKAKSITKLLREKFPKIKAQIQGEAVRVTGTSKDELQQVMNVLREYNFDFPIAFNNYR